jgi:hypothetical protein
MGAAGHGKERCLPTPCLNGGRCTDEYQGFGCVCTAGYGGDRCTQVAEQQQPSGAGGSQSATGDPCAANPCLHGGSCRFSPFSASGYRCDCPDPRWQGSNCSVYDGVDQCLEGHCCNGQCRDGIGAIICTCLPGWYGVDCSGRLRGNRAQDRTGTCQAYYQAQHDLLWSSHDSESNEAVVSLVLDPRVVLPPCVFGARLNLALEHHAGGRPSIQLAMACSGATHGKRLRCDTSVGAARAIFHPFPACPDQSCAKGRHRSRRCCRKDVATRRGMLILWVHYGHFLYIIAPYACALAK